MEANNRNRTIALAALFQCVEGVVQIANRGTVDNDLLNITDKEKALGFKYVFQTQITADTVNERMRSAMGLFSDTETYIDNDAKLLMGRLHEYYN